VRDPIERIRDMLEAITRIERYSERGREAFERDELIQVWIVHHLQVIGEAAAQLGRDFHAAHPGYHGRRLLRWVTCLSTSISDWISRKSGEPSNATCPNSG